jgi:hypothetical protein
MLSYVPLKLRLFINCGFFDLLSTTRPVLLLTAVIWKDKLFQLFSEFGPRVFILAITSDVLHRCVFEPFEAPLVYNIERSLKLFDFFFELLNLL